MIHKKRYKVLCASLYNARWREFKCKTMGEEEPHNVAPLYEGVWIETTLSECILLGRPLIPSNEGAWIETNSGIRFGRAVSPPSIERGRELKLQWGIDNIAIGMSIPRVRERELKFAVDGFNDGFQKSPFYKIQGGAWIETPWRR